jgi:PAX-interacting protein 1
LKELKQILSVNGSTDGQEPTSPSIKSDIDNNKSDDKAHQIIGSVETKTSVDDLLQDQQQEPQYQKVEVKTVEIISQVQQQQELQQVQKQQQQQQPELLQVQQIKSSDNTSNTIKMIDIYEMEEKIKQSVINEIEGQIIKPDADYKNDKGTLDQEQMYANSVDKSDTFRGGTDFKLFNPSTIMFQQDDSKTMAAIMFGAQTAKQFQKNDQHQDDMKDNPISRGKRKTQKSVKFQIEEDKVIEAYVTHWQELEKQDRVQQGQEVEQQDHNLSKYAIFIREDHNFRHGAVHQISSNTMPTISRHKVSWLAGV